METKKMTDAFGDKALSGQTPSGIQIILDDLETENTIGMKEHECLPFNAKYYMIKVHYFNQGGIL